MKSSKKLGSKVDTRSTRLAAVAMVAAAAMAPVSGRAQNLVEAGSGSADGGSGAAMQKMQRQFSIGGGSLPDVLEQYRQVTGISVRLGMPKDAAAQLRSNGISGTYADDEALRQLLTGTSLTVTFQDAHHATASIQHSDSVSVLAGLQNNLPMNKFSEDLIDTPQTVDVVPKFLIEDQGTSTLKDALRNVPGISLAAGEAGAQGDNLTIRGFTARNDIFLDGIRDFGSYYRDGFNYEAVEALEGPAGIQFGRGSTGGVINQESKVPVEPQIINIQTQFGTDATRRITADINEPMPELAAGSAFRVNIMGQEGGVAGRPFDEIRRFGLAPSVSFGLNSPTRFTLSYFHLSENDTPDYGLPWFFNQLAPGVSRHAYFGFPDENSLKTNDDILTAKFDHDFTKSIAIHSIARAANYPRTAQITEPQICSNPPASVPVGGYVSSLPTVAWNSSLTCSTLANYDPAKIVVNRNQIQTKSVEGDLWDQTEVTAHFKTFGLKHNFVGGIEGGQEISNPIRYSYTISGVDTVPTATLLNPDTTQVFSGTGYTTSVVHTKVESVGLYFVDTIKLGRLFEVSGGARWDRMDTGYSIYQPVKPPTGGTATATAVLSLVESQPTYRAAFVYKPTSHGSVYFDYGTSFNPAAESLSLSVTLTSAGLKPEENESYEGGVKYSFLNERLQVEGAVFRTEKDNARETSATDSTLTVNAGNQLVKGAQFSVVGRLPQGMDLVAGYAYLDSKVLSSPNYPTSVGFPLANVPKQTFNVFVTHKLPLKLIAGVGGNYVGSRTASSTVPYVPLTYSAAQTFAAGTSPCGATATKCYQVLSTGMKQVPGYWIFNAMVKRPLTDKLELQANVYNLLNRFYIDLPHPSHLVPGAGASALIGVNYKF
ncbi:TonB-dependent receptor [Granulicella sp. WH15]|uniref:TonB-dependent siderophore receptor n=1 Tax=Granulicella sp. WH15 TaxID=2602070 RepID=UPI0013678425|nr:TonB-dependent siderophore receptor [Granulicella sp. WH15]QHN04464.1 TonB-dependent receptor [Granulicella sp. WH15]